MSHHYSGPDFGFPHGDARLDLTDLYAFPKPGDAGKSILVMNVHPSAVVTPPGRTTADPFAPEALYEIKIDTNGDAVADMAYRVRFSASRDGSQTAILRRVEGAQAAGTSDGGQVIVESAKVSTGRDAWVTDAGEYCFFAGWRSDPFFFDVQGMLNNQQFTGDDFFADKDVCGIVLEVPNSALPRKRLGLWARTLIGAPGSWVQVDRGALPAQAVFLVGEERDAYLAGEPANDSRFVSVFAHSLEHLDGYTPEQASRVAGTLLPEILPYDPIRPASFPSNGRTLTDDAGDSFVAACVLHLQKLSREDQVSVLIGQAVAVSDAEPFLDEAGERGLGEFLDNPQNLIMLWRAVQTGTWPATRTQLFERATELMLQESNMERARSGGGAYSVAELRPIAGAACAARLSAMFKPSA
jgi:hypothetical protein